MDAILSRRLLGHSLSHSKTVDSESRDHVVFLALVSRLLSQCGAHVICSGRLMGGEGCLGDRGALLGLAGIVRMACAQG